MYLIFITTYAKSFTIIPILEMKELSTEINVPKVTQLSVARREFRQPKCKDHGLRVGEDRKKIQAKQVWFGVRSDSQLLRLSPVRTPHQTSHTGIPEFGEFSGGSAGSTLADPPLSVGPAPRPPSRSCA